MRRRLAIAPVLFVAAVLAGCAGGLSGVHGHVAAPPAPDSATIALWHLDENGGTLVADSGPFRLDGAAGIDTRTDFGRFRTARVFGLLTDSFLFVPFNPVMNVRGPFTVEAWIKFDAAPAGFQVIAARWTPTPNEQSWLLGISGLSASGGWLASVQLDATAQRLLFGYEPDGAGSERGYTSNNPVPIGRWVHVAASVDGEIVRLFVDGRLDAQYVNRQTVRPSPAPLVIGNAIDTRHLTSFGGDLRVDPSMTATLAYPFEGVIDEVRLSRGARMRF